MEKRLNTKKLVKAGLLCALVTVLTIFVQMPIPAIAGAYINGGDAGVYLAAFLLGGPWGAAVAGVGSAIADMALGSMVYAPATLVIKAAMAFFAARIYHGGGKFSRILAPLAGSAIMIAGYFLYESVLFGPGAATASVLFNLIQAGGGTLAAYIATRALDARKRRFEP